MNIDEAIQGMIDSTDYEVSFMGEQFLWHKGKYIKELMDLGFSQESAKNGLAEFCVAVADAVKRGKDVTFPNYREEVVALIAKYCQAEVKKAA